MSVVDHVSGKLSRLDEEVVRAVPPGGNWRDLPDSIDSERVRQIRESAKRGEGSRSTYYGRLRWNAPSYTISTYFNRPGNGCFIHPEANRLITIREAARLQSFPDCYRFWGRGRARFIQVGNAVPPLLAYSIGCVLDPGPMVDLFSGAGGLSLGFESAGFSVIASVDSDAAAATTYQLNRPSKELVLQRDLSDPASFDDTIREIRKRAGHDGVQILAGGPPCQGFSTAGNSRIHDTRNLLVYSFLEAVRGLQPRYVLMENVPAMAHRRHSNFLLKIRRAFEEASYSTLIVIAHAEAYGVPQLRRRLFLLAARGRDGLPWPKPTFRPIQPSQLRFQPGATDVQDAPYGPTVADAIGDLPLVANASEPDVPVAYAKPACSQFQHWARGGIGLEDLASPRAISSSRSST